MQTPWMLMTGCGIVGWLLPEFLHRGKIPVGINILGAAAGALISGSFVF